MQFDATILEAKKETRDILRLRFDTQEQNFEFAPGQYLMLSIATGLTKPLSICSSPTKKGFVEISKKITESDFSKKILSAKKGDTAAIQGPFGKFVLDESEKNTVMLSGGIGITPLRSMIQYAADKKLTNKIALFYSNRVPEEIAFFSEFEELQKQNKNLKVINSITRPEESKQEWRGRVGRIDKKLVLEFVPNPMNCVFYSCGPPSMVDAMKQLLKEMNVPSEKIKTELFAGYT